MKLVKHCLLLVALLSGGVAAYTQTADEIISKHIEAVGGKEKLSGLKSVKIDNSIEAMDNVSPSVIVVLNGKGYRSDADFGGQKLTQVYTDKSGWTINPFTGANDPTAMPDEQYKSGQNQIYIVPLLDYAAKGDKAELLGQEKVGNVNAYKIKVTGKNNAATTYFFDPTTYYIIQTNSSADFGGQMIELKTVYSDHKKTDGLVWPYTSSIDFGGQFAMTSKINKVEVNGNVDAGLFEMKK
jgi:hypothetical protein